MLFAEMVFPFTGKHMIVPLIDSGLLDKDFFNNQITRIFVLERIFSTWEVDRQNVLICRDS